MRKIGSCPPICARALNGRARNSYKQEEERQMTRREMREHCFKILFGVEFYPTEEIKAQVEQYFQCSPTPSIHRLRRGLPGYLILFAPHLLDNTASEVVQ